MKPPMNESVDVHTPILDESGNPVTDRYGKPRMATTTTKSRVQYSTKTVRSQDGQLFDSALEVDLPPSVQVSKGSEISYVDDFGHPVSGKVLTLNESTNLAGNKVYFRTVTVG